MGGKKPAFRSSWRRSVWRLLTASVAVFATTACVSNVQPIGSAYDYRLDNGAWYLDGKFAPKTGYIWEGKLVFDNPGLPARRRLDLSGRFVVPPYCEGHNHNIGGRADGVEDTSDAYLRDGIFYAMMFGSFRFYRDKIEDKLNRPGSVDVVFANNGLTGPGGHPRGLREFLMERFGSYPEFSKSTLPDAGYFEAETVEQVRQKWGLIRAEKPDFVKAMLYFSEEWERRKDDPEFFGSRGLKPELFQEFVRLAKRDGLRVAVHVESEADMVFAIKAGADIIAHLPSYDADILLSDDTIELVRSSGVALVTTFSLAKRVERRDPELFQEILKAQKINLKKLAEAGAWLVVGSDNTRSTSSSEAEHLLALGAVSNRQLLDMWTWHCSRLAFPNRKVGRLESGFEASFLVLRDNPLEDFANTKAIDLRFKDGQLLGLDN